MGKRKPALWRQLAASPAFRDQVLDPTRKWSVDDLAAAHGVSFGTARLARNAVVQGEALAVETPSPAPAPPVETGPAVELTEARRQSGDTLEVQLPRCVQRVQSLEDLFRACQVDGEEWEVESWTAKAYQGYARDEAGQIVTEQLYSVSARFKARRAAQTVKQVVAELLERAAAHVPHYAPLVHVAPPSGRYLHEYCVPDAHLGKLAWSPETGDADYDLEIAEQVIDTALESLLHRCSAYPPERILFPVGHDLLHVDGSHNLTTRGTPQDVDGRFKRTFRHTVELIRRWAERLSAVAPVDLIGVPGNHDREAAWAVMEVVRALFERCPHVTVNNDPRLRKYYTYGRVLLTLTHGSEEKPRHRLSEITAAECPVAWGNARVREAHVGHLHHYSIQERHGFRVRVLPSLCPADAWHAASGYVGSIRSAIALVWHPEDGLAAELHHNVFREAA